MNPVFELSNGVLIPQLGFGTWQIKELSDIKTALTKAIEVGYRHIDTAQVYGNEEGIGEVLQSCGIPREELFITTKVWNSSQGYESTLKAFAQSCQKLQTDYIDLYLIHWPAVNLHANYQHMNQETWRAMEELYRLGKVRAIGVSNFFGHHLDSLLQTATIRPMVNQIELHPGNPANELVSKCQELGILVEAYSPMMKGKVFQIDLLLELANKYQRTVPQIVLRWILDRGIVPLSKSITPERIEQNAQIFDFELSQEDHERINELSTIGRIGTHPDHATF
ncbi:MAG: aldo/keto reductase [Candidatus Izemoplasmatales bacterium]|nr:aldo/keto reductase [bacterium]MDZ4196091.1 aldo/keto reductase [Candidatus Izemoplasmatales bacterium]